MDDWDALLQVVLDSTDDGPRRNELRAEFIASGRWTWTQLRELVLAHPACDGPRRLAADWLAEQGHDERSWFIRVQCDLAALVRRCSPAAAAELERLVTAQARLAEKLDGQLADGLVDPDETIYVSVKSERVSARAREVTLHFVRGFVEAVDLTTAMFTKRAARFFSDHPIRTVRLTDKEPVQVREGWWWADTCLAPSNQVCSRGYVPPELYNFLLQGTRAGGYLGLGRSAAELTYPTAEAAHAGLSAACVMFGRRAAGLVSPIPSTLPSL